MFTLTQFFIRVIVGVLYFYCCLGNVATYATAKATWPTFSEHEVIQIEYVIRLAIIKHWKALCDISYLYDILFI